MGSFTGSSKALPDQPVRTVDPEVERLAHVVVDGLIARLALEPLSGSSLLDNLAGQLEQAAACTGSASCGARPANNRAAHRPQIQH